MQILNAVILFVNLNQNLFNFLLSFPFLLGTEFLVYLVPTVKFVQDSEDLYSYFIQSILNEFRVEHFETIFVKVFHFNTLCKFTGLANGIFNVLNVWSFKWNLLSSNIDSNFVFLSDRVESFFIKLLVNDAVLKIDRDFVVIQCHIVEHIRISSFVLYELLLLFFSKDLLNFIAFWLWAWIQRITLLLLFSLRFQSLKCIQLIGIIKLDCKLYFLRGLRQLSENRLKNLSLDFQKSSLVHNY